MKNNNTMQMTAWVIAAGLMVMGGGWVNTAIAQAPRQAAPKLITAGQATPITAASGTKKPLPLKPRDRWVPLFNGKDLTGWTAKIRGHRLGDNYANTFRVVDGKLVVSYADYTADDLLSQDPGDDQRPAFNKFGHLFYNGSFAHYVLRIEYRFVGQQIKNGPGWAKRNNGVMIHGQDPDTMHLYQKFPISLEVQLLGGRGNGQPISTLNLCTPGTNALIKGQPAAGHCTASSSSTYEGDQWVSAEIEVRSGDIIRHRVEGQTVLEYTQPEYDLSDRQFPVQGYLKSQQIEGLKLERGTISLQSESHPTEFRKIEIRVIK